VVSHQILEGAVRQVLDTTAGVNVDEAAHVTDCEGNSSEVVARLTLGGGHGGTLVVNCSWAYGAIVAAGMLGMDGDGADETLTRDALDEAADQIGGLIRRNLEASSPRIMPPVPVVVSGKPATYISRGRAHLSPFPCRSKRDPLRYRSGHTARQANSSADRAGQRAETDGKGQAINENGADS
jgi:CheY-specific phosphatase CheX